MWATAMLLVAVLTGCKNEMEGWTEEQDILTMQASIFTSPDSRLVYGDDSGEQTQVYWDDDLTEYFTLCWSGGDNGKYVFQKNIQTEGARTATFQLAPSPYSTGTPNPSAGSTIYAVYYGDSPLHPGAGAGATSINTMYIAKQAGTSLAGISNCNIMVAEATLEEGQSLSDVTLNFEHKIAIAKLTLKHDDFKNAEVKNITVKATGLLSTGQYTFATKEWTAYTTNAGVIEVTGTFTGNDVGEIVVYLALVPSTISDCVISASVGTDTYEGSLTDKTIVAGKLYSATVSDFEKKVNDYTVEESEGKKTYVIYTAAGLKAWADQAVSDKKSNARLEADIDMAELEEITVGSYTGNWKPVCEVSTQSGYSGTFDGNGHKIKNLKVVSDKFCVGMIGYLASGGCVKDVTFVGDIVLSTSYVGSCSMGVAVGRSSGSTISGIKLENVSESSDGTITYNSSANDEWTNIYAGGIVGDMSDAASIPVVKDCQNSLKIMADGLPVFYGNYIGGIVGINKNGVVLQCINEGDVATGTTYVKAGGIAGQNGESNSKNSFIIACANWGTVTNNNGIANGNNATTSQFIGCYTTVGKVFSGSGKAVGCYDGETTNVDGITQISDFNAEDVVNGMNTAITEANNTHVDKQWQMGQTHPELVSTSTEP